MVLICKTLSPFHLRMLDAKFGWNWPNGSTAEDIFRFGHCVSLFRDNLPLEKGVTLHLNKLQSSSPKDALCQVWLKLAQCFWRRWECEKFRDGRTPGDQKSSLQLSAVVSWKGLWILICQHHSPGLSPFWTRTVWYLYIWYHTVRTKNGLISLCDITINKLHVNSYVACVDKYVAC